MTTITNEMNEQMLFTVVQFINTVLENTALKLEKIDTKKFESGELEVIEKINDLVIKITDIKDGFVNGELKNWYLHLQDARRYAIYIETNISMLEV